MRAFVATEQHFIEYNGAVYMTTVGAYSFWQRYLDVFDEVVVVARVEKRAVLPGRVIRADGDGVCFFPMPDYTGPWQYLRAWPVLRRRAREVAQRDGAFILRIPGAIGTLLWRWLKHYGKPFGAEIVGDPYDSLSPQSWKSRWAYLVRPWAVRQLKAQCREACCTAYVTREALQRRYPPGNGFSMNYSSLKELPESMLAMREVDAIAALQGEEPREQWLVFVGTLAQLYKGPDVLIRALGQCVEAGTDLHLTVIGDGRMRPELEMLTDRLGLTERVHFLGQIPSGEPVFEQLRRADLFVLPSRQEGLPRAMIEAMACGLPCIGSTIGGIPELLSPEDMVPPGDANALAQKISKGVAYLARMQSMARRNLAVAQEYRTEVLEPRRTEFYEWVWEATERWLARSKLLTLPLST